MRITSNFDCKSFRSKVFKSARKYIGGVARDRIRSSLSRISSRSFGYSSNRLRKPKKEEESRLSYYRVLSDSICRN